MAGGLDGLRAGIRFRVVHLKSLLEVQSILLVPFGSVVAAFLLLRDEFYLELAPTDVSAALGGAVWPLVEGLRAKLTALRCSLALPGRMMPTRGGDLDRSFLAHQVLLLGRLRLVNASPTRLVLIWHWQTIEGLESLHESHCRRLFWRYCWRVYMRFFFLDQDRGRRVSNLPQAWATIGLEQR